jgi:hypothetical protein
MMNKLEDLSPPDYMYCFNCKYNHDGWCGKKAKDVKYSDNCGEIDYNAEPIAIEIYVNRNKDLSRKKLVIPMLGKSNSEFSDELGQVVGSTKSIYYRPVDNTLVRVSKIQAGKDEDKQIQGLQEITPKTFITLIENFARLGVVKKDPDTNQTKFLDKSISVQVSDVVMSSDQFKEKMPIIHNVYDVPLPVLNDGELIFPRKGYDDKLYSFLSPNAPDVNKNLPLAEAKELIEMIFSEFCFESEQDKVNAIAALITPYLRCLYNRETCRTPIFFYIANRERAGKDYCAEIRCIVYYGQSFSETPITNDNGKVNEDEFRKKLVGKFKSGCNIFHSENNKGYINSAELEKLATSEYFTDRLLGQNNNITFPNILEISLSANTGITYTPDFANRSIFINLMLDLEDPNQRKFKVSDLHHYVKEHRNDILSALYAFVREWYIKGMPAGTNPFASYPEWARVCGGVMEAVGYTNPCVQNLDPARIGGDTDTKDMKRLFELCHESWGSDRIKKKDILNRLCGEDVCSEEWAELFTWVKWQDKGARGKFGKFFEKYVGRIFSGIKLCRIKDANGKNERNVYYFENVGCSGCSGVNLQRIKVKKDNIISLTGSDSPPKTPNTPTDNECIQIIEEVEPDAMPHNE